MAQHISTFKITIMTPDKLVYENEIHSLFVTGDRGEYELLPYHYPVLGIVSESNIILNWKECIPVKTGVLRFFANDCIILVEQAEKYRRVKKKVKEGEDIEVEDETDSVMKRQF